MCQMNTIKQWITRERERISISEPCLFEQSKLQALSLFGYIHAVFSHVIWTALFFMCIKFNK